MIALVRYLAADAMHGQRWLAPMLCCLAATIVFDAGGASAMSDYGATATVVLLPAALWLTIAVAGSEDRVQTAITVVTVGSATRVRLAKLIVTYVALVPLVVVAVLAPAVLGGQSLTGSVLGAGLAAHLMTALAGVALGAPLCRPVISRTAWTVLAAVAVCLAELLIPDCPPSRQLLSLLSTDHPQHLGASLGVITAQTVALAAVAVLAAQRLARART